MFPWLISSYQAELTEHLAGQGGWSALLSLCRLVPAGPPAPSSRYQQLFTHPLAPLKGHMHFCAFAHTSGLGPSHFLPNQNYIRSSSLFTLSPSCGLILSSSASQQGTAYTFIWHCFHPASYTTKSIKCLSSPAIWLWKDTGFGQIPLSSSVTQST